jgi:uroporphyrinogen III methyltransferase / synthase
MTQSKGKVYLVGAGLADVKYLTLAAHNLLTTAEVLIYDALVDSQLFTLLPANCLMVDVGKRGGKPSTAQSEINRLLINYCQQGKQVIRLKSGDPFIFGRSAAEITALKAEKCDFEVIAGISSALAAPLLAGIPLTDPVLSRCFAVISAHEPEMLNWEALSSLETLVILMGGKNLAQILHQLLRFKKPRTTPIGIIRWAGTLQQQTWLGTLDTILVQTEGISLSPAVIIIGEVVGLAKFLQPESRSLESQTMSSKLPLVGKTILVTRASGQSSQFSQLLTAAGAKVVEMPTLEITSPSNWQPLDNAIAQISYFDWLILTSSNAVEYFLERLLSQSQDTRVLGNLKIAVVGEKTSKSLEKYALKADFIPPNFIADSLVESFPEPLLNKKLLFPRVESGGREILVKEFSAKGAEVIEVPAYQSSCPQNIPPDAKLALRNGEIDVVTFASSKTVQFFYQLLQQNLSEKSISEYLAGVCIASIGPQTSKTCQDLLGRVDIEAEEYTLPGLTQALIKWGDKPDFR